MKFPFQRFISIREGEIKNTHLFISCKDEPLQICYCSVRVYKISLLAYIYLYMNSRGTSETYWLILVFLARKKQDKNARVFLKMRSIVSVRYCTKHMPTNDQCRGRNMSVFYFDTVVRHSSHISVSHSLEF